MIAMAQKADTLTVKEIAYRLRCAVQTVLNEIERGKLRADKVGRTYRVPLDECRKVWPLHFGERN